MIDLGLTGRTALVTGGAIGIGLGIAEWLAQAGCAVALVDRDPDALAAAATVVASHGTAVHTVVADLRVPDAAVAMVDDVVSTLGGLDVAVNNVGSLGGRTPTRFLDATPDDLAGIVEQNLLVTTWSCHAEARRMVDDGTAGVIVNVSSGESTRPSVTMPTYGAAKAAINHLTATLAVDLAPHGIRVLAVAPGTTLTPVVRAAFDDATVARYEAAHPLGRLSEPADLGRLVVALASDLGRAVTGQVVFGDNGAHLSRNRPT